jgi:hypothetical protein
MSLVYDFKAENYTKLPPSFCCANHGLLDKGKSFKTFSQLLNI